MLRMKIALGLLLCVVTTLATPSLAASTRVDQGRWTSLKKDVRLPNGVKLAYIELGNSDGPPLLLLHGYTDTSRSWSMVTPYLADYRLIIPDQRGHGASDAPMCCYALSVFADDARLLLDALGIERTAVVGHSLGSMVAMTMAAEYPERVSALGLVGSTALIPVKRGEWLYEEATAVRASLDPQSKFLKEWHPANQPTPVDPTFAAAVMDEILAIRPHVWRSVLRELVDLPVSRHAADIRAPVLILSGAKDALFPSDHHAALLKAFPRATAHVFPDLGHNPNFERPDEVGKRIASFLKKKRP